MLTQEYYETKSNIKKGRILELKHLWRQVNHCNETNTEEEKGFISILKPRMIKFSIIKKENNK